jgi:hypothetical protein
MNTQMFQDRPARRSRARAASIGIVVVLALLVSTLSAAAGQGASGQLSADAPVMAPQGGVTVGNYVWCDKNHDGSHQGPGNDDEQEPLAGIAYVELQLQRQIGGVWTPVGANTKTDNAGWYNFSDGVNKDTEYRVVVVSSPSDPSGPLFGLTETTDPDLYRQPFTTTDQPYDSADFGYDGPSCHDSTAVALSSFSAGPTANLLLVGLGGAILVAATAVWGARRRRAAVPQQ